MVRLRLWGVLAAWLALVMTLTACDPIYRNHGYVPREVDLVQVKIGDPQEAVNQLIGRPSAQGMLNDDAWYYVQSRWIVSGLRGRREIDREVVAISFDSEGRVTNIERFGLENGQVVVLSRRVTESSVVSGGALRQIFGNVGRMNAADLFQ